MRAAWVLPELGAAGFAVLLSAVKRGQFPPEVAAWMYDNTPEAPSIVPRLREAAESQDAIEREFGRRVLEQALHFQDFGSILLAPLD